MKNCGLTLLLFTVYSYCAYGQSDTILLDSIRNLIVNTRGDTSLDLATYFIYDDENRLMEKYSILGRSGRNYERETFSYSTQQDTTTDFEGDGGEWVPTFRTVISKSFDDFGSTIRQEDVWDETTNTWIGDIRFSNYYNDQGFRVKNLRENFDEDAMRWDTNSMTCNFYDNENRLTITNTFFRSFSGNESRNRIVSAYDENSGRLVADTTYSITDAEEALSRRSEYFFDQSGRRIRTLRFSHNGETVTWDSTDRFISEYDSLGLPTRFLSEDYDTTSMMWIPFSETLRQFGSDSTILLYRLFFNSSVDGFNEISRVEWTVDAAGRHRTEKEYRRNSSRVLVPSLFHTYTYNDWDLLSTEKIEDYADTITLNLSHRINKYFYSDGTTTAVKYHPNQKPYTFGPNPTKDYVSVFGRGEEILKYEIYDLEGKALGSGNLSHRSKIHLPDGKSQAFVVLLRNRANQIVQVEQILKIR